MSVIRIYFLIPFLFISLHLLAGAQNDHLLDKGEIKITTKDTIHGYFDSLKQRREWESFLSEDVVFTSFTSPVKKVSGKTAFLDSTKRFYSMIISVEVKELLIEENKACALIRYELQPPTGSNFRSDVAEIFTVRNGKIDSFAIYFDSSPFPK